LLFGAMGIAQAADSAQAGSSSNSQSLSGSQALSSVNNTLNFPGVTSSTNTSTANDTSSVTYSGGVNSNTNVNYSGTQTVKNVPGIYAPNLTNSITETCLGSASGGVAGPGFGISLGKTITDEGCERRLDAAIMAKLGMTEISFNIMCQSKEVAEASKGTNHQCPSVVAEEKATKGHPKHTDPIIRRRLGLPPLPESEAAPQ